MDFNKKAFSLNGDTTFEDIKISDYAQIIFACYHKLTLGDGITASTSSYYPAIYISMGIGSNADIQTYTPGDVYFTMNSGTINQLYGGNFLAGNVDADAADYGVKIEINSGATISTLWGSSRHGKVSTAPHKNIDITVNGGKITNLYGAHSGATISGDLKISVNQAANVTTTISGPRASSGNCAEIKGDTILNIVGTKNSWSMPTVDANFTALELTNTAVTIADPTTGFWSKVEKLTMTDDSTLAFSAAPTKAVDVTVTQAQSGAWNTSTALITAPTGTGNVFSLTSPDGYSLPKAGTEPVTWTLTANPTATPTAEPTATPTAEPTATPTAEPTATPTAEPTATPTAEPTATPTATPIPSGNVVYVHSVNGLDTNDGLTDQTPLKTIKAAYDKAPKDNVKNTIVVMNEVRLAPEELKYSSYDKTNKVPVDNPNYPGETDLDYQGYVSNTYNCYLFPAHTGEVVITAKYGDTTYENGVLNFGKGQSFSLSGDTTFENIKVSQYAEYIFACYNKLTLGTGIDKIGSISYYPAKHIFMGITNPTVQGDNVDDVYFTMNSGKAYWVYGGNRSWTLPATANYDVNLVINGGQITTLCGTSLSAPSSTNSRTPHKNINVSVNGGTVTNLTGAYAWTTVSGNVRITLNKSASITTKIAATPIYGSGTVNPNAYAEIKGDTILNIVGADSNWSMPSDISGFSALELTNSAVTINPTATVWSTVGKLAMTDDSTIAFSAVPTQAVDVTVNKSGNEWNLTTPLITAPSQTGNLFTLVAPFGYKLTYGAGNSEDSWTLAKMTELPYGVLTNETGSEMDINLKLPTSYTALNENATAYETYLQKVADMEAAGSGKEVPVVNPVEIKGEVAIYVDSQNGSDSNKGTEAAPLATIQKALDCVASLQTSEEPFAGIVVYLRGGTYNVTDTINITSAHSGKNQIPVIISAYNDEEVVISGGTQIAGSAFKAVSEISAEAYNKLPVAVRDEVVAIKLADVGISTAGAAVTKDGANYQVFVDGEELTLSRYPNATKLALLGKVEHIGYINFTGDSMGTKGDNADDPDIRFAMTDLRPTLWNNDGNIWLKGSLYAEWLIQNIRVKDINAATGIMTMDGGTDRGAKTNPNNTYYYYNILEELDVPGEFYLDTETGILYMYPISDMSTATVTYSDMQDNIINLSQTESVVLNGLTIECGANYGIDMTGCKETLIQNCTVRNLKYGVRIRGEQSGIIYSEICKTMQNPVIIGEAVYPDYDYTPEENFMQNCYIHTTGNPNSGNVKVHGTGNVVSHNLLQGMYNSAIYLQYMKECIIEYNEITGAPSGVFDMGAIYAPHHIMSTGTHVRYNYIHDIGTNSDDWNPNAIYFDEGLRGNYAYGNIIENVPSGFLTNSGVEHVVIHNIIANGREATKTAIYGSDNFKDYTIAERFTRSGGAFKASYEQYLALSDAKKAEVKGRYPLMVKLFDAITAAGNENAGVGLFASQGNYVHENLIYNHGTVNFSNLNNVGDNTIVTSNPFTNVDAHDFTLTDASIITWADKLPSMDKIGILTDSTNTKEPISEFDMYAPSNGNQKVDPFKVLLKWSVAGGADDYVVKISKNANMSDAQTYETINRNYYFDNDEFFAYDTTYYWTVTANTTAESRSANSVAASNGAVYSFKTMTQEEYLAANPLDTTALEETITEAENFLAQVTDESDGGLYADGTHEALEAAITAAKAIMNDLGGKDQVVVNQAKAVLAEAIRTAQLNRSIQYVTFEELRAEDWASVSSRELLVSVEADELKITRDASLSSGLGQTMYTPGIGVRDILCFQYKIDSRTSWHGFVLAQANENAYAITNSTDGYFICINTNQVELQKRQNGGKVGQIDKAFDTTLFDGGEYYDIEIGAINYPDGSVGIHFKIGDTLIFDPEIMRDTTADVAINDADILSTSTMTAIVGEPFVDTPTFGTVLNRKNGPEYLKLSGADYTELEAELAQADSLTQSDYTTDSWNAYQALLDEADALATNLAAAEQASVDEMTAKVKAAREALVAAASPTATPTAAPTATPTAAPTATPTAAPTATPTAEPTATPTAEPTATPTAEPTATPAAEPTATPAEKPEIIVEGTVTSYSKGSNATVSIHCTGDLKNLTGVKMDNHEVDKANYAVKEGSTIVTFKTEYLENLSVGEHTVTLLYSDGSSADSKLTIMAATADGDTDGTQDEDTSGEDSAEEENAADSTEATVDTQVSGPSTGDSSNLILWIVLMAAAAILCGIISMKVRKSKE